MIESIINGETVTCPGSRVNFIDLKHYFYICVTYGSQGQIHNQTRQICRIHLSIMKKNLVILEEFNLLQNLDLYT